jgi:hypothetical protein
MTKVATSNQVSDALKQDKLPSASPAKTDEELSKLMQKLTLEDQKPARVEEAKAVADGLQSLGDLYLSLLTEQLSMKDTKAKDLHNEIQGITDKTKAIDELLNLIIAKSQANTKDGSVDCKASDIVTLVDDLRKKGINVSLPNGTLKKDEIPRFFTLIGNERQSKDQEIQQKAQAFQQTTMERNQLIEFVKGQLDILHRTIQKITYGITSRSN